MDASVRTDASVRADASVRVDAASKPVDGCNSPPRCHSFARARRHVRVRARFLFNEQLEDGAAQLAWTGKLKQSDDLAYYGKGAEL